MVETTVSQATRLIRARMSQIGMRQDDLAVRLNVTQSAISKKMNGTSPWKPKELAELAIYLEHPPLLVIAKRLGYVESGTLAAEVADKESLLASQMIHEALRQLSPRERQVYLFLSSLVLGGLAPMETTRQTQTLRALSRFDLVEQPAGC